MKSIADWLRTQTPNWTDDDRYHWVSTFHAWMLPACLVGGFFVKSWSIRMLVLIIQVVTLFTEFYYRDCLITMIEKEFSEQSWDDVVTRFFKQSGWNMTRGEKMAFNIGLNLGVLVLYVVVLLRESLLWLVGVASISVTALPVLAWFSRVPLTPEIASMNLR